MQFDVKTIKELEKQAGLPLYVFEEEAFVDNYCSFEHCFSSLYENYKISYSYKTNYAPYICRIVKRLGGYAEVVSDMELEIARSVGYEYSHIVYNGPSKGPLSRTHLMNGGILNVDNFEELKNLCVFVETMPDQKFKIGFRVNIDIGQGFVSRFGIDESDLPKAFEMVNMCNNLSVNGLHCHIGRSRTILAWQKRVQKMLEIADRFFEQPPEYVSLGSGMFGIMEDSLGNQFGNDRPTFSQYAEVVAKEFATHYQNSPKPVLFTEPGTTLVNKYIDFIAQIESIKNIKGKTFVVLNCSKHNLGEICELKQLPITIVSSGNIPQKVSNAEFVGYTCLEHDVMYRNYNGEIAVGDYIVFGNVGGYSNVSKPPFIRPNCAMVSSTGAVIKRTETVKEILSTYE